MVGFYLLRNTLNNVKLYTDPFMKRIIGKIILLSTIVTISACNQPIKNSNKSINSSDVSLSSEESVKSTSPDISTTSVKSSSIEKSSSSQNTSSGPTVVDNQLSTENGLVVKFKNNGASIDKITWKGKQIAKDGFVVGRCANRIAGGTFKIDGTTYNVSKNDGQNSLHGGSGSGMNSWRGPFATKDWTKVEQTESSITYSIHSADKENGYPGNMDMTVKYTLSQQGELLIEYRATTDAPTLCNPTNHLFIAVNGNNSYSNIKLQISADNYTPLKNSIPTGQISPVEGTQFDYRTEKAFDGSKSYDDNLCLNGEGYRQVASLTGETTYLKINVSTDRPGLQLYKDGSGNICLETQMYPDAINQANFADPILRPGEEFYSKTTYSFLEID